MAMDAVGCGPEERVAQSRRVGIKSGVADHGRESLSVHGTFTYFTKSQSEEISILNLLQIPLTFGWRALRVQATSGTMQVAFDEAETAKEPTQPQTAIEVESGFATLDLEVSFGGGQTRSRIPIAPPRISTDVLSQTSIPLETLQVVIPARRPSSASSIGNIGAESAFEASRAVSLSEAINETEIAGQESQRTGLISGRENDGARDPESQSLHSHRPRSSLTLLGGEAFEGPLHGPWRFLKAWHISTVIFNCLAGVKGVQYVRNYPDIGKRSSSAWAFLGALVFGLVLDLGTTGAAVVVGYRSVPKVRKYPS